MIKKLIIIIFFILLPTIGWNAPSSITATWEGNLDNGDPVTITGSGFDAGPGNGGPNVIIFENWDDDGQAGTENDLDATDSGGVGAWSYTAQGGGPLYHTSDYVSGNRSAKLMDDTALTRYTQWRQNVLSFPNSQEFFMSWWWKLPTGKRMENSSDVNCMGAYSSTPLSPWNVTINQCQRQNTGIAGNYKFYYLGDANSGGNFFDDDNVIGHFAGNTRQYWFGNTVGLSGMGDQWNRSASDRDWLNHGDWIRHIDYMKGDSDLYTTTGSAYAQRMNQDETMPVYNWHQSNFGGFTLTKGSQSTNLGANQWNKFSFLGYSGTYTPNAMQLVDDFYFAAGDNAYARVEICNTNDYDTASKCFIAIPTSWSSGTIAIKIQQGNMGTTPFYVHVFDAAGGHGVSSSSYEFDSEGVTPTTPTVDITLVDGSLQEDDGSTIVGTVDCDEAGVGQTNCEDLVVSYTFEGDAVEGTDFMVVDPQTVRITDASTPANIVIDPLHDGSDDGDKTLIINLSSGTGYNVVGNSSINIDIIDIDVYQFTYDVFGENIGSDHTGTCEDTYLNYFADDANLSGDITLSVYTSPDDTASQNTILQFDLSSIPQSATVASAELCLYVYDYVGSNSGTFPITAHKVTQSNDIGEETWLTYDGTNSWSSAGGDYDTYEDETASDLTQYSRTCWDIPLMVQAWVTTPAANYGVLLRESSISTNLSDRDIQFMSSNYNNSEYRPTLEINWTAQNEGKIINIGGAGDGGVSPGGTGSITNQD